MSETGNLISAMYIAYWYQYRRPRQAPRRDSRRTSRGIRWPARCLCIWANAAGDIGAAGYYVLSCLLARNRHHMAGSLPLINYGYHQCAGHPLH